MFTVIQMTLFQPALEFLNSITQSSNVFGDELLLQRTKGSLGLRLEESFFDLPTLSIWSRNRIHDY